MASVKPFLMFHGVAGEAVEFYTSIFAGSEVKELVRYDEGEMDGQIMQALIEIHGQDLMIIDSPVKHDFDFTPALSLFVTVNDEQEIDQLFGELSTRGKIMMPLDEYPFAKKFAWVSDRFGVSWQLILK